MLNERHRGYVNYLEHLATQPTNHWEGFSLPRQETIGIGGFGLRHQIAFACYALGAFALHPEASEDEQARCCGAMAALIDRMLQRRVWAYWALHAEQTGENPDPLDTANLDYSGHLAMMIGCYEAAGGDQRYDSEFVLRWGPDRVFHYTHTTLLERLWQQMCQNDHYGIESEPGTVHLTAMCHALWATLLHDSQHTSTYAQANAAWLTFVRERMILRGPRLFGQGVFMPTYVSRRRLAVPISLNLVDAWALAFLAALAPDLVEGLLPRFRRCIRYRRTPPDAPREAFLPSAGMWQPREVADQMLTTGFAHLLAVEWGDATLAADLHTYAEQYFDPIEQAGQRSYTAGLAPLYTTALFALGEAGGLRGLRALLPSAAPALTEQQA